jgi:hypothetical protein
LLSEVAGPRQRIEVLEEAIRRLTEATEGVNRGRGEVSDDCPEVKRDLANLGRELAKLKEEVRAIRANAEPHAPPVAAAAVPPGPMAPGPAQKSSSGSRSRNVRPPPPKPGPVKLSPPPAPPKRAKQFPPSVKNVRGLDVPDGIIAHLTRECGGNVHDRHVVDVTSGSFEKETYTANPHSGAVDHMAKYADKNAADLETDSLFNSTYRGRGEDIPHTKNNWVCYDFKEKRIVPTHYTIRSYWNGPGGAHLKSWLVETSADGESWREVDHQEDNKQLKGTWFTGTFAVAGVGECRFIRLVNIGRNHFGDDQLLISAWEIFGTLLE